MFLVGDPEKKKLHLPLLLGRGQPQDVLVGGFKHFFSPLLGEMIQNLTDIFQTGWNHQLVCIYSGQISSRPHTTDFPQKVTFWKGNGTPKISGEI